MRENRFRLNGRVLLIPFTLICFALTVAEAQHNPLVPLAPADLIKFLPTTPTGWELKQSNAKNFFVEWLCSQATRDFQRISAITDTSGNQLPKPIVITSIDELTPSKNSTSKLFWGGSPIPAPSPGR